MMQSSSPSSNSTMHWPSPSSSVTWPARWSMSTRLPTSPPQIASTTSLLVACETFGRLERQLGDGDGDGGGFGAHRHGRGEGWCQHLVVRRAAGGLIVRLVRSRVDERSVAPSRERAAPRGDRHQMTGEVKGSRTDLLCLWETRVSSPSQRPEVPWVGRPWRAASAIVEESEELLLGERLGGRARRGRALVVATVAVS